jgi:hypothetical protein
MFKCGWVTVAGFMAAAEIPLLKVLSRVEFLQLFTCRLGVDEDDPACAATVTAHTLAAETVLEGNAADVRRRTDGTREG